MTENRCPLANDINGEPFDLPPEAVAWRVRRRSGKQGRPQTVFDPETGTPLEMELGSEIDDLRPYGAGGYRLDAIDEAGKGIPGATAYVEVSADEPQPKPMETPSETAATLREVTALLRESMQTHCRAVEAMAAAFGPVRSAAAAREPERVVITPSAPPVSEEKDMMGQMKEWLPLIQNLVEWWKGQGVPGATAAAEPTAAGSAS